MASLTTSPSEQGRSSPPGEIAFLVHSQQTLNQNLPPDVDNKALARQRRRRTSPEDQKILEEEYLKNARPDKATRLAIVKRVALGEKEVQIWFQNRRSNTRRKSRPAGSHEQNTLLQSDGSDVSEQSSSSHDIVASNSEPEVVEAPKKEAIDTSTPQLSELNLNKTAVVDEETQTTAIASFTSTPASQEPAPTMPALSQASQIPLSSQESLSFSSQNSSGYVADRRSALSTRDREEPSSVRKLASEVQPRLLSRSSSYLRLSMTDDGQAKVVDRGVQSPSPEKPKLTSTSTSMLARTASLRRSYSAAGLNESIKRDCAEEGVRKVARVSAIGRSRDSRTWEFWCDSDARNSLIERAEQETSGSAAEAIVLMRSNSSRALRTNAAKMNSPSTGHNKSGDGAFKQGRPSLKRATTHHGRIQSKLIPPKAASKKDKNDSDEFERPNTDSDKENWEPDDARRGPSTSRGGKKVLGENSKVMSQSSSLGAHLARERQGKNRGGSKAIEVDDEVSSFMGGADENRAAVGDDLDCVQSLLSLSQGNWV